MLVMIAIVVYLVIGVVFNAILIWQAGEVTLEVAPVVLVLIPGWPLLAVFVCANTLGPWWEKNRNKVLWSRK